jgi:hypothetical protein
LGEGSYDAEKVVLLELQMDLKALKKTPRKLAMSKIAWLEMLSSNFIVLKIEKVDQFLIVSYLI